MEELVMGFREEKDTMGVVRIPDEAYYGPQTQRAAENFPISELTLPKDFIRAVAMIKKCAAEVNHELGLLETGLAKPIADAAQQTIDGSFDAEFIVDVFQTGSGTSTNMNVNEVIATRANEIITGEKHGKTPVHPNDHVNLGQSSNDVVPTAMHMSSFISIEQHMVPSLKRLQRMLSEKEREFEDVKKIGRTHLQDAVPIFLGQEFSGYARQIELSLERIYSVQPRLAELALGGTAVGNGLNTHPEFAARVIERIRKITGHPFKEAENHFEAQSARDAAVEVSGALKTIAVGLNRIANDIRWLASGPRTGIGEINIPSLQPGSSIMPGKINPVIPEAVIQVSAQVIGNDATITMGGQGGNFELNVMMPVMAYNLLQSISLLSAAADVFAEKCIRGITANRRTCAAAVEKSLALTTGLVPYIGYDRAAEIAKAAYKTGKTVFEIALAENVLPEKQLRGILT